MISSQPTAAPDIRVARADIVLIAGAHNPSILSPEWLKRHCGLAMEPLSFVHTPEFSLFDAPELQLVSDSARLQIAAKNGADATLHLISEVARGYIEALPHIPYRALGFNVICLVSETASAPVHLSLSANGRPADNLPGYETQCGGLLYGQGADHRLKVLVERGEGEWSFGFNFHFDLDKENESGANEKSATDLASLVQTLALRARQSRALVGHLLNGNTLNQSHEEVK